MQVPPPQAPSYRLGSTHKRNDVVATSWPRVVTFLERFVSNDEVKSKTALSMRRQLAGEHRDGISNELNLKLSLAMVADVGRHVATATYVLARDSFLVGMCARGNSGGVYRRLGGQHML